MASLLLASDAQPESSASVMFRNAFAKQKTRFFSAWLKSCIGVCCAWYGLAGSNYHWRVGILCAALTRLPSGGEFLPEFREGHFVLAGVCQAGHV